VSHKNIHIDFLSQWFTQMLTNFQNSLLLSTHTVQDLKKLLLNIPQLLTCVATLPYEIFMSENVCG